MFGEKDLKHLPTLGQEAQVAQEVTPFLALLAMMELSIAQVVSGAPLLALKTTFQYKKL